MSSYPDFVITQEVNAPLEQVWQAWTQEENLTQWWGPADYDLGVKEFNLQPDGIFHYYMSTGDEPKMWGKFVYKEVEAPNRLVFISSFSDEEGNLLRAPFSTTWPLEMYNEVTLEKKDGNTLVTLTGRPYNAMAEEVKTYANRHDAMRQGFSGTFAKLVEFLA